MQGSGSGSPPVSSPTCTHKQVHHGLEFANNTGQCRVQIQLAARVLHATGTQCTLQRRAAKTRCEGRQLQVAAAAAAAASGSGGGAAAAAAADKLAPTTSPAEAAISSITIMSWLVPGTTAEP